MGTERPQETLSSALFGITRRRVIGLLLTHPDEAFYVRQIARAVRSGLGAVDREVRRLAQAGILRRTVRGRQVFYQADAECPIFPELKSLVVKTVGVGDVLRSALLPIGDRIRAAFVFGSFARGEMRRTSDVDVLVIGDVSFADVVSALGRAQELLSREVNPTVYGPDEFLAKWKAGHSFLRSVMRSPRIPLIGGDDELAAMVGERLADPAPAKS